MNFFVTKQTIKITFSIDLNRGNPSNHQRYRKITIYAYGLPTAVVVLTMIAEAILPVCSPYKPRFGESGKCTFAGKLLVKTV